MIENLKALASAQWSTSEVVIIGTICVCIGMLLQLI